MKRSTAIRHLTEMAEVATERLRLRSTEIGWPLEELWVSGQLLDEIDDDLELERGSVVLVLDLTPDALPWLAAPSSARIDAGRPRPLCNPNQRYSLTFRSL